MKKIILDMDPGIDDAAAISVAINNPNLQVELITSVVGNVTVDRTTTNALKILEFFGRTDIPVARGADKPLRRPYQDASSVHGKTGMDGYDFPEPIKKPIELTAVEAIHEVVSKSQEKITIVATGAYTNIANYLNRHPKDFKNIEEMVLMGGTVSRGNVNSVAEFNIYTDPDAAKIVFDSPVKKTMIGLDVTLKALLTDDTIDQIEKSGKPGQMLAALFSEYHDGHKGGKPMHDVNTILYLLNPELIKVKSGFIDVVVGGTATGATVWDFQNRIHSVESSNAQIGLKIDPALFNQWFLEQVSQMEIQGDK
ncbi:MAG: ribonucleoside hydrolase RihC [Lactobacillaceae bacterium]|jgi:non-specific riboncleoside hydrolase|nr:ribonucleoside hydrolase RihC [Lactobacillaceae bacterium]